MKRAILLGLGALGLAAVLLPAIAMADSGFPPGPPATFYGTTPSGISVGQGVIAIVVNGSSSTVCGAGSVVADTDNGGKPSYAVDVVSASQITGCGVSGSTVMFYFTPFGGHSGQLATDTATWTGPGATLKNITTLGPLLQSRASVPNLAKDGTNY
jgi:hypothetical protein